MCFLYQNSVLIQLNSCGSVSCTGLRPTALGAWKYVLRRYWTKGGMMLGIFVSILGYWRLQKIFVASPLLFKCEFWAFYELGQYFAQCHGWLNFKCKWTEAQPLPSDNPDNRGTSSFSSFYFLPIGQTSWDWLDCRMVSVCYSVDAIQHYMCATVFSEQLYILSTFEQNLKISFTRTSIIFPLKLH